MCSICLENGEHISKLPFGCAELAHDGVSQQFRLFCKFSLQNPCETQQIQSSPDNSESRDLRAKRLPQLQWLCKCLLGNIGTPGPNASWATCRWVQLPAHPPTARTPTANASRAVSDNHARMPLGQYCRHVRTTCSVTFDVKTHLKCLPGSIGHLGPNASWAVLPPCVKRCAATLCTDTNCKCLPGSIGPLCPNASWAVLPL